MKYNLLVVSFFVSFSLSAQESISLASITKGFSAGAHAAYISHENNVYHEAEYGYGFGVKVQYGINHNIAVALSYQNYFIKPERITPSLLNRYQLFEYDITGKYIFGTSISRLRPNLQAGINYTTTDEAYFYEDLGGLQNVGATVEFYGLTFLVGGGLSYFFTPHICADLSVNMHNGQFSKYYLTPENSATFKFKENSGVFNLNALIGMQYHF